MDECSRKDFISDLPDPIIDCILTKLPLRDAVRTCVLSTKWRYQWATMTQLVFDENCLCVSYGSNSTEEKYLNFLMRCLFLHNGPIIKFRLSEIYLGILGEYPDLYQCLRFLSRKGVKELVLDREFPDPTLTTPSSVFSCQRLTSLFLSGFEVKLPLTFQGFPYLKYLNLECNIATREVVENLISGCPLLENFKFIHFESIVFTVCAPNLKHLILDGNFIHIYLEHAPLLATISIEIDTEGSEGNLLMTVPVTYYCLKFIELKLVHFEEMNEVLYVLHLILQSPNVEELQISAVASEWAFFKAADANFWEKKCPTDFTFKHLKIVKISGVSNQKEMEFIKFVLQRSPVLEVMRISKDDKYRRKKNLRNKVLRFKRASPNVDIRFF